MKDMHVLRTRLELELELEKKREEKETVTQTQTYIGRHALTYQASLTCWCT